MGSNLDASLFLGPLRVGRSDPPARVCFQHLRLSRRQSVSLHPMLFPREISAVEFVCWRIPAFGVSTQANKFNRRDFARRSEEHTSELQSPCNLVCRLLL